MSAVRLSISFLMACCVTTALFWLLWTFIAMRDRGHVVAAVPHIEFSRLKRDSELHVVKRVKPQIDKPTLPPSATTVSVSKTVSVTAGVDTATLAPAGIDFGGTGEGGIAGTATALAFGTGSDRDAVPQVRIDPNYPPSARAHHTEGWVEVQFDIGSDGSTENVSVVRSEPPGVFEEETVRAVSEWKYNPKIQDGKAVERKGVRVRLDFTLDGR